jgi:hypothetical protein
MEPNQELLAYIKAQKEQGSTFEDIEKELKQVGWAQVDIDVAMETFKVSTVPAQEKVPEVLEVPKKTEEVIGETIIDSTPLVSETPTRVVEPIEELKKTVRTHETALVAVLLVVIVGISAFSLWWYLTQRVPRGIERVDMTPISSVLSEENTPATTTVVENATSTKKELPED